MLPLSPLSLFLPPLRFPLSCLPLLSLSLLLLPLRPFFPAPALFPKLQEPRSLQNQMILHPHAPGRIWYCYTPPPVFSAAASAVSVVCASAANPVIGTLPTSRQLQSKIDSALRNITSSSLFCCFFASCITTCKIILPHLPINVNEGASDLYVKRGPITAFDIILHFPIDIPCLSCIMECSVCLVLVNFKFIFTESMHTEKRGYYGQQFRQDRHRQ